MHEDRGPRTEGRGSTVNAGLVFGVALMLVLSAPSSVHAQVPSSPLPRAERLIAANQLDEARRIIDGVLARDPGSRRPAMSSAPCSRSNATSAARRLRIVRRSRRDDTMARAHDRLGFVLGQGGATDAAIAEFRRAVTLDPRLADAQYHLGATLWWTKQIDDARRALERAVALRPDHAESRYYLGLTKRQQGDLAAAITDLRRTVALDPQLESPTCTGVARRSTAISMAPSRSSSARRRSIRPARMQATAWDWRSSRRAMRGGRSRRFVRLSNVIPSLGPRDSISGTPCCTRAISTAQSGVPRAVAA